MSLRGASFVFAAVLAVIGVGVAVTLIVLTTHLHRASHEIATSVESLQAAEELEIGLVSLRDARRPTTRAASKDLIRRRLADAAEFVDSSEERERLASLEYNVGLYIAAVERAPGGAAPGSALEEQTSTAFAGAFRAARAWFLINVQQSRGLRSNASRWDEIANVIGTVAIALLVIGLGGLGVWLQRSAFRPALNLVGAIERYGRGERAARAREEGPKEFRTIAHHFNDMASRLEHQREGQLAFLAGVAHDIRGPLAALKMNTAMVPADEPLPPERYLRQLIARVDRQIDHLARMAYDFLDASRIESGNLELRLAECDMRDLARATFDLFEPAAQIHQLVLDASDAPVLVRCDRMRVEQVLGNLVSNAIKYSPRGGPVRVTIEQRPEVVSVAVTDTGIGMSPNDIEKVFDPFRRSNASKEAIPGVGLGLFVVRRIVEAHGGNIVVDSTQGMGSTFTVHLPAGTSGA